MIQVILLVIFQPKIASILAQHLDFPSEACESFSCDLAQRRRQIYQVDSREESRHVKISLHGLDIVSCSATYLFLFSANPIWFYDWQSIKSMMVSHLPRLASIATKHLARLGTLAELPGALACLHAHEGASCVTHHRRRPDQPVKLLVKLA